MASRKYTKTHPGQSTQVLSPPLRANFLALDDRIMGASAQAQTTPDMTVVVTLFDYLGSDGQTWRSFAGGNSPIFAAPTVNPKIGMLTVDDGGLLAWTYGAEAPVPLKPNPPAGRLPICFVHGRVGMTAITDDDTGGGFILAQASALRTTELTVPLTVLTKESGAPLATTGVSNVVEKTLATFTLKGGTLGTNRMLRVKAAGDILNNSGGTQPSPIIRFYFGATVVAQLQNTGGNVPGGAARSSWSFEGVVIGTGATNTQFAESRASFPQDLGASGIAQNSNYQFWWRWVVHNAVAVDSTIDQIVKVTMTNGLNHASYDTRGFYLVAELLS